MAEISIVTTTLPGDWNPNQVGEFITTLVSSRIAACVQYIGMNSVYRWEGEIQHEDEWQIIAKTTVDREVELIETIQDNHPYDIPQIINKREDATTEYADWVATQVE